MSPGETNIRKLVQGFATHIRELKAPEYKESQVRLHYIDPFWRLLGWDVDNRQQQAPQDTEVLIEPSMDSVEDDGLRSREPDYLFRPNGFPRFIVEAKKPSVDLDTAKKAIFQAKCYAWNAAIPFAVLMDFEQFRLYDATLRPILNEPDRGLVKDFAINFEDYPAKWEEMVATFGRDAVADGALEQLRAKIRKAPKRARLRTVDRMLFELRGDEPVDRVFLDYLEKYRQHLANAIYHDNKKEFPEATTLHGAARLTEAVQRLIDRMVFLRACEDRGIRKYGLLKESLDRISSEGGNFYQTLCSEFRQLDGEYNGYLFKYHFSESLKVSDDVLADFVRTLYPPDGPWNFAAIGDDVLGIVYERFLGNVVTVRHGHATVEEKPEVRHAGGVYYTPRFVVDTIIRRVIGPQIEGKAPPALLDLKILDPACGSGSFLVAAFQYLIDHCLTAIAADPALASVPASPRARKKKKDIAFKDKKGVWYLAPDFKAALLTHCLHGVDIDQQAVEVTVMSLYLKMLEGQLPPNWQKDWLENELLPSLDNNIRCGNSLIDSADFDRYVTDTQGGLFPPDEDVRFRINRFDWASRTRGFGTLLDSQAEKQRGRRGFDCIIGNPPYIRVQELNKWAPDECEFYKWRYESAKKGNYDIYVVFVEKCLSLLAANGLLGFIMPHKFWQAKYGEGLRKIIADGKHLKSVIDFGDQQVFRGATTYTAIQIFERTSHGDAIDYAKIIELTDGKLQCAATESNAFAEGQLAFSAIRPVADSEWSFVDTAGADVIERLKSQGSPLGDIAKKLFVGLQTSADKVFILERRETGFYSTELETHVDLEESWLHPLLKGSVHMKRWVPAFTDRVVVFPYEPTNGKFELVTERKLKTETPKTWSYFEKCRPALSRRERGTYEGSAWYGYVYPKNLSLMALPKILTPSLAQRGEFSFDKTGDQFFVGSGGGGGGGYGILLEDASQYEYLLGLLNSELLNWFLRKITTPFHSGWYAYSKAYIEQVPIKMPDTSKEKKLADRIAESVRTTMDAKTKLQSDRLSDRDRGSLERTVESNERRIDEAVFELYGVDGLPE
ncbi:MAG: Eco57I restriction-modification methylase domain-containing protein [Planctomycetes bacterium]|nr:Eco57I restriction-modification methylase domain-containing protein [Planctomycetota bacterium]